MPMSLVNSGGVAVYGPARDQSSRVGRPLICFLGDKMENHSPSSIAECVRSAFALARDAERLRADLAIHLSNISPGRDQAVINSCYLQLTELVSAFGLLEDKLAEWRSLGRYQL
jgi:hypothetical protein